MLQLSTATHGGMHHAVSVDYPADSVQVTSWLFLLLMFGPFTLNAQMLASPTNYSAVSPFGTSWIEQIAYDRSNDTLYLPLRDRNTIIAMYLSSRNGTTTTNVPPIDFPPPASASGTWPNVIIAGRNGTAGSASITEVAPRQARFNIITGLVGWSSDPWSGLWVSDGGNSALRFIHFKRGNNVTLVAGSNIGAVGANDGIGAAVRFMYPHYLAWGIFMAATVVDGGGNEENIFATTTTTTTVLFICDHGNKCIRQGDPLHNKTYQLLDGSSLESLVDMVLNVSTFAGICGTAGGTDTGLAYQRAAIKDPVGIALVNPFPQLEFFPRTRMTSSSSSLLFSRGRGSAPTW